MGIFFGATVDGYESVYLLKMVRQIHVKGEVTKGYDHSEEYIGVGNDHAMSFDTKDVTDLVVEGAVFNARDKSQNGDCWATTSAKSDADHH